MKNYKIIYILISFVYIITILTFAGESDSHFYYYTVFTTEKNSHQNILLSYINSTSSIKSVVFLKLYDKNVANISQNSELILHNC